MSLKKLLVLSSMGAILLACGIMLWAASPEPVQAQCDDYPPNSSCITCHEKEYPVFKDGEWHSVHGRKDCCAQCHGGNCSTMDKELAHQGMVANPLDDIYTNCYHCHPDDYKARAARFAALLGVRPYSSPTATPVPVAAVLEHPMVIIPESTLPVAHVQAGLLAFWGVIFIVILALGIELGYFMTRAKVNHGSQHI
jgi:hypothetical protein